MGGTAVCPGEDACFWAGCVVWRIHLQLAWGYRHGKQPARLTATHKLAAQLNNSVEHIITLDASGRQIIFLLRRHSYRTVIQALTHPKNR
ncbi:hypothetical protein D3C75_1155710 [compost metagenome]